MAVETNRQKIRSLRGCLKQYAKPELMDLEKSAWQKAEALKTHKKGLMQQLFPLKSV